MTALSDEFDNEWLCPYCAVPTRAEDKVCPGCRRLLTIHKQSSQKRSVWLWRGVFFQYAVAVYLVGFGAAALTLAAKFNGVSDPTPFAPLYVGLPTGQPEELNRIVLAAFPRWIFWSVIAATFYSVVLLIVLAARIRNGNLLYLVNAGMVFALGGVSLYLFQDSVIISAISIAGMGIGVVQLFIAFKLAPDFTYKSTRLTLKVDSKLKEHTSFFLSGRDYAQSGLWGLAVVHFRRAVAGKPQNVPYRLALAVAYINIKRYELAEQTLTEARRLAPDNANVLRLWKRLERLKRGV